MRPQTTKSVVDYVGEASLQVTQQLKSKAWADIVESLVGLIYLEAGEMAAMEFLVYLGIISEVPRGFEREPAIQITEVNMALETDQLAADIAAVESAAAAAAVEVTHADSAAAAPDVVQAGDVVTKPAVDMAAVESAAAAVGVTHAEAAAAPEAMQGGDAATKPAVDSAAADSTAGAVADSAAQAAADSAAEPAMDGIVEPAGHVAVEPAVDIAAESPGDADVAMPDANGHSKSAGKDIAPASENMAGGANGDSDMVVDENGDGHITSDGQVTPPDSLHAIQPNDLQTDGVQSNGVHANGVHTNSVQPNGFEECLPELSAPAANGVSASTAVRSDAQTCISEAVPASKALDPGNPAADAATPQANGHIGVVARQNGSVASVADPNIIDIGDGEDEKRHKGLLKQAHKPKQQPRVEMIQSGYPCQSGYGDSELSESDSELSDSPANSEETSMTEPGEIPPSPTHPAQPMDTDPPAASTPLAAAPAEADATALGLASGAALVDLSGAPIKIKIEPGLEAEGAANPSQNQSATDAMAFLAMNGDDSDDEQPRARPRRGQVSCSPLFQLQKLIVNYNKSISIIMIMNNNSQ